MHSLTDLVQNAFSNVCMVQNQETDIWIKERKRVELLTIHDDVLENIFKLCVIFIFLSLTDSNWNYSDYDQRPNIAKRWT